MSIDYLSWEMACVDSEFDITEPRPLAKCLPTWYTELPGNLKNLNMNFGDKQFVVEGHHWRSGKFCLGLRGIKSLGYTIPLPEQLNWYPELQDARHWWKEQLLHPEMLHGSRWCTNNQGHYDWNIKIISFPWRAKMAPGWRLMITAHPLNWSPDWHCFSGCVDANFRVSADGHDIGEFWNFPQPIDTDYNYYNVETVLAIRENSMPIDAGECFFSMVPVYDPDYQPAVFKHHPQF